MRGCNSHDRQERYDEIKNSVSPVARGDQHSGKDKTGDHRCELDETPKRQGDSGRKEQGQVLRPALTELAEASVHAGADGIAAITKADLVTRGLYDAGEFDIFKQGTCNGNMP